MPKPFDSASPRTPDRIGRVQIVLDIGRDENGDPDIQVSGSFDQMDADGIVKPVSASKSQIASAVGPTAAQGGLSFATACLTAAEATVGQ